MEIKRRIRHVLAFWGVLIGIILFVYTIGLFLEWLHPKALLIFTFTILFCFFSYGIYTISRDSEEKNDEIEKQ